MNVLNVVFLSFVFFLPQLLFSQKNVAFTEDKCFASYREGEYERSSDCINSILYTGELTDTLRLLKAYEILGASLAMLDKKGPAKAAFRKMLTLKPDADLNPNVYLPDIISLFQIAKFEYKTQLRVVILDTIPAYPRSLNFLPFAVPQFLNKEKTKGTVCLPLQVISLGLSIYAYNRKVSYNSNRYGYREEDLSYAQNYDEMYKVSLLIFSGSYIWSLIDGFIHKPLIYKM